MEPNEIAYEHLIHFIHEAIESEQGEPRPFNIETEKRMALVYLALQRALNVGSPQDSA